MEYTYVTYFAITAAVIHIYNTWKLKDEQYVFKSTMKLYQNLNCLISKQIQQARRFFSWRWNKFTDGNRKLTLHGR